MIAFDLETTAHRDKLKSLIQEQMLVLTCGTKSIRLRPVLTFSEEDVERACEIIEDSLSRLEKEI
jgi:L-lysine 6-transaminase